MLSVTLEIFLVSHSILQTTDRLLLSIVTLRVQLDPSPEVLGEARDSSSLVNPNCMATITAEYGSPSQFASAIYQQTSSTLARAPTANTDRADASGNGITADTPGQILVVVVLFLVIFASFVGDLIAIRILFRWRNEVSSSCRTDATNQC